MRLSKRDWSVLPTIVCDSLMYNWDTIGEAVVYVTKRLGKKISNRTYAIIRDDIKQGNYTREFYSVYAREGYKLEHIQLLQTGYMIREKCLKMIFKEEAKDYSIQDKKLLTLLFKELRETSQMIDALKQGTPAIAEIEGRFDEYEREITELNERLRKAEVGEITRVLK